MRAPVLPFSPAQPALVLLISLQIAPAKMILTVAQDENDDYCSACGGVGELVCCENCPRSFHFGCVDLGQSDTTPDEWFCNLCFSTRYPTRIPEHKGAFGGLLNGLEKTNPQAFKLPREVQLYFEGVKIGADGEYEDVVVPSKPK